MTTHYVNNQDFLEALVKFKEARVKDPEARVPEYIGQCLIDIARRFARSPNFANYSYKEEMISDAVENCLMYITNFDPEKSKNPFAYFTQICFYAFIRRITSEKKQSYIKHKLIQDLPLESFNAGEFDDAELSQSFVSFIQAHNEFDGSLFEKKLKKKTDKKKPQTNLEILMEGKDTE